MIGGLYGHKIGPETENPDYVIHGGLFLRLNDALVPVVKLDHGGFSFAFSYDFNISRLKPASLGRGGFEISLAFIGFRKNQDRSTLNSTLCPKF
jgi:hypothetical protein